MSLTRKRRKALKRLKSNAQDLWVDQQALLEKANRVAQEAKKQARALADEEVVPRVRGAVGTVGPVITSNVNTAKVAAFTAKKRFLTNVLPAVGGAIASTAAVLNMSDNPVVKNVVSKTQPPKRRGVGGYVALGFGIVAVLGIGYALWQTFRADDELWISEDELDSSTTAAPAPPAAAEGPNPA